MKVTLRPVREDDLDRLNGRETTGTGSPYDDFGFSGVGTQRRMFQENGFLPKGGERGRLAITVEGDVLCGTISWHTVLYGENEGSRAFNVGLVLFPEQRRKGIGPATLRAITEYLFAHFTVDRLEGSTDVENTAMQRAAERAGFRREGVLRGAQFRLGERRDLVLFSRLRSDRD
jgi:RimJ/RimL family protein N-acetyltransferase